MSVSTAPSSVPPPKLSEVFEALQKEARKVAADGRNLYGAQAKTYLKGIYPDFSEANYGFRKFVELLKAGDEAGVFSLEIVDGHPRIREQSGANNRRRQDVRRLKPDLWNSLVTWDSGIRFWDRNRRRAIFLPTGEDGAPAWETSPESFVPINEITMTQQLEWMHDFASTQEEPARSSLLAALSDPSRGAFKRGLDDTRRAGAWRQYLHQRVLDHAMDWAARNELPASVILEPRDRGDSFTNPRDSAPSTPDKGRTGNTPQLCELRKADHAVPVSDPLVNEMRSLLHQVIDEMSFAELAVLPIPAAYFIKH